MKLCEVITETPTMGDLNKLLPGAKNAINKPYDDAIIRQARKDGKLKVPAKTAAPAYAGKSYHNFMQRGPSMSQARMTSKQYGAGRVGLT